MTNSSRYLTLTNLLNRCLILFFRGARANKFKPLRVKIESNKKRCPSQDVKEMKIETAKKDVKTKSAF